MTLAQAAGIRRTRVWLIDQGAQPSMTEAQALSAALIAMEGAQ